MVTEAVLKKHEGMCHRYNLISAKLQTNKKIFKKRLSIASLSNIPILCYSW